MIEGDTEWALLRYIFIRLPFLAGFEFPTSRRHKPGGGGWENLKNDRDLLVEYSCNSKDAQEAL